MKHLCLLAAATIALSASGFAANLPSEAANTTPTIADEFNRPDPPRKQKLNNMSSARMLNPQPEPPGTTGSAKEAVHHLLPPGPCKTIANPTGVSSHADASCKAGAMMGSHTMTGTQPHPAGGGSGKTTH